jgi:hypothetical protein
MCGALALAGRTVKRDVALTGGVALRVGVDEMRQRARLTHRNQTISRNHRNRTISSEPIRAPDLARRMAELQALREMVRRAESHSNSEVRPLARIGSFV